MYKKMIALLVVFVMVLSMTAACNEPTPPAPPAETTPKPVEQQPTEAPKPTDEPAPVRDEKYGGDLVYLTNQISNTIDAHASGGNMSNYMWMQNIFEPPLMMGSDGQYYPSVCDYEYSDDGLTLKLTVRDRRFSNGQKVKIEDVVASLQRIAKLNAGYNTKVMANVTDIKIDGDTATFTYSELSVALLQELGDIRGPGWVMPKEICDKYGENEIDKMEDVIGTGPYTLGKYEPEHEIVVVRNENYDVVDVGGVGPAAPKMAYVDSITYAVNTDSASSSAGMIAGKYHIGGLLTALQPHAEEIGLKPVLLENQWTHAIFFNLSKDNANSPIQDVNLRKAIRAALDMNAVMLSLFQGDTERYELDPTAITKYNTTYYNTIIKDTEWNIADKELAKQYLAKSNYKGEEIIYLVSADSAYYRAAMGVIPQLEEIGIKIKLWTVDRGSHSGIRNDPKGGFDIGIWETQKAISNPYESATLVAGTAQGWWEDATRAELVNKLRTTKTGTPESVKIYEDICRVVAEGVPYICFGTAFTKTYTQPNVELNYTGTYAYYWNTYFTD